MRSGLREALTRQVHRELDAARDELVVVDDELRRLRIEIER